MMKQGQSRGQRLRIDMVKEKNDLSNNIKICPDLTQCLELSTLLCEVKKKLRVLRKAERSRKRRWNKKCARKSFVSNPYSAGKNLLCPKVMVSLEIEQQLLDNHKTDLVFDSLFDQPLPDLNDLPAPPSFKSCKPFSFKRDDFLRSLNSRKNNSAPGLNRNPYKVYKKCPKIQAFFMKIFKTISRTGNIPAAW